jgi:hypothetical protein
MGYSMQKRGANVDNQSMVAESASPVSRPLSKIAASAVTGCNGPQAAAPFLSRDKLASRPCSGAKRVGLTR